MISKVQQKKDEQGYTKEQVCCRNCSKFLSQIEYITYSWTATVFTKEKNKRCSIGNFAVQSSANCRLFERAEVKS